LSLPSLNVAENNKGAAAPLFVDAAFDESTMTRR
jgi:hypothetical protein